MTEYNPFTLEGKEILVTGASSGIGKSIAIECSRLGAKVVITGRNEERLANTYSKLATKDSKIICADLSTEDGIAHLVENIGPLDGIVHCAGMAQPTPFRFLNREKIDVIMEVNFYAPAVITQKALQLKKIKSSASLVFISSISGVFCSYIGGAAYSASKGAINGLVKSLAIELSPKNIRVNSVNPGMISTDILNEGTITEEQLSEDAKKYPLRRYGKPEEVAYAAIYLLSDASSWVTGSNLLIDGGYTLI